MEEKIKVVVGNYRIPITLIPEGTRLFIKSRYHKGLIAEIKQMEAPRWHGYDDIPKKMWSIENSQRNRFQLEYLKGNNPYALYDRPVVDFESARPLYDHQKQLASQALAVHYCLWAAEMGTGKTLAAIEVAENAGVSGPNEIWYVGPKSGVRAVERELIKWDTGINPTMLTYEGLVSKIKHWDGSDAPKFVIFDESSKIKNATAQRSQSAMHLANSVRDEWSLEGYVILMTGTPAPKTPVDWWHQCIAGDTLIATSDGMKRAKDLVDQNCCIIVNGKKIQTTGFFYTGKKQLLKVETKEGYSIRATADHRFMVDYDGFQTWRELGELGKDDKLVISDPGQYYSWTGVGRYEEGYILGLLYGDGTVYREKYGRLQFFPDDYPLIPYVLEILGQDNIRQTGDARTVEGGEINSILRNWGVTGEKEISDLMLSASSDFIKGFLSGFFDADGSVEQASLRITLAQVNKDRIYRVQLMLQSLGIYSKITQRETNKSKIEGRVINTSPIRYDLSITNRDAIYYDERIGFNHPRKSAYLKKRIKNKHSWSAEKLATITSITEDAVEDVYDVTVPGEHCFSANGFVVHNCEIACPGYLKEGNANKFKARLCLIEERESATGGVYPHIVTWLDDARKCAKCGEFEEMHTIMSDHPFVASKNEVDFLYERMKGIVTVLFKKDCLDLPEKQYELISIKPTPEILRVASTIRATAARVISALTLLRELSDGFQYTEVKIGEQDCQNCFGDGKITVQVPKDTPDTMSPQEINAEDFEIKEIACDVCGGKGKTIKYQRSTDEITTPKDQYYIDLLDEHEDIGRFIVWGGFTGTIDRLVNIAHQQGWATLRVDGRGYIGSTATGEPIDSETLLDCMDLSSKNYQEMREEYPKVCFVGHPQAGGMALTLTASPTALFYSNSFHGEARMQAEDRFHRAGMDTNRACRIIDMIYLASDKIVLDNLKNKKKLQSISLGELENVFKGEKK